MGILQRVVRELRVVRSAITRRLAHSRADEAALVDEFHHLYYEVLPHQTWQDTRWMGQKILKCPLDVWQLQEILWEVRPDLIIETGTCFGGSALMMGQLCDILGTGRIITVDIAPQGTPPHPRVTYLTGSSVGPEIVATLRAEAAKARTVMVILDSDHSKAHVAAELAALADLVTVGSYLIVEDTNVYVHPVAIEHGPGPMEAMDEFLAHRTDFQIDPRWKKFLLTFNPRGYLKRVA